MVIHLTTIQTRTGVPNFRDADDDGDGTLTKTEYDRDGDGEADDDDEDGIPDYLDIDNT